MERNNSLSVAPTLIIGFGGTGALALQYAKQKMRARLKQYAHPGQEMPRKIPFVEYLVLDTTPLEERRDKGRAIGHGGLVLSFSCVLHP